MTVCMCVCLFVCVCVWFVFHNAVGPSRTKLVTPNSSLKFTPEELVLYCRDLRVICFLFDRLTPETQAVEVCVSLCVCVCICVCVCACVLHTALEWKDNHTLL